MNNTELNHLSTKWIESLVIDEINMDESGIVNFNDHIDTALNLEDSSIEMMDKLRENFEIFVTKFNDLRNNNDKSIKLFKISNTINDFLLFRNSLKLVISRSSNETITIGFMNNSGNFFSTRNSDGQSVPAVYHELKAIVGAFNNIKWTYQGDPVEINSLVKFYLSEFIKQSAS